MIKTLKAILLAAVLILAGGCGKKAPTIENRATVAVEGDVDSFNPLFAEEIVAGEINDLIFPRLVDSEFDSLRGLLMYVPYLAKSWEITADDHDIVFHLRADARWSDGVPVTARDVQFSFLLYGDSAVASVRQSVVDHLRLANGKREIAEAIVPLNDSTVVFHFESAASSHLFDVGVPLVPSHVFSKIPRKDLRTHTINRSPVTCGPFALGQWTPMQEIILVKSLSFGESFQPHLSKLIFRVLPDYRTRVAQLQTGEVDIASGLRIDDAELLSRIPHIQIHSSVGRDYDFLGWNNLDPVVWAQSNGKQIRQHPLFGSSKVRRALTMAINRNEIVNAYLRNHGREAIGGVSPLFTWAFNDTLSPLPFDKKQAADLLSEEGWKDTNGDGVLEKNGKRFSFALKLASGNQLRDVIATVVQQQLKDIKIDMRIEQVERGTFWNDLMQRKYDAWFAGFSVPMQMQLDDLWGGDLTKYPFNLAGFQNKHVDQILASVRTSRSEKETAELWKAFQTTIHKEQPYTFLFWINNIVARNTRLQGTHIGILGTTHRAWQWHLSELPH